MKVHEIITEAPVGGFTQGLRKFGARALNALGAKGAAMNIAGKVDVGDLANDLFGKFNSYLGTQGVNINAATANDVIDFLDSQGFEAGITPSDMRMPKQAIEQEFLRAAQSKFRLGSRRPAQTTATAVKKPQVNQEVTYNGVTYRFLGQQWAEISPKSGKPFKVARKEIVPQLEKLAANPTKQAPVDYDQPAYRRRGVAEPVTEPVKTNTRGQRIDTRGRFTRKPVNR